MSTWRHDHLDDVERTFGIGAEPPAPEAPSLPATLAATRRRIAELYGAS